MKNCDSSLKNKIVEYYYNELPAEKKRTSRNILKVVKNAPEN